jgi:threonine-phosphate decarboxylase
MALIQHGGDVFQVAREQGWDWREVLDFSANINPLGPSPRVKPAICRAVDRIVHYPEREPARLREMLAGLWGVGADRILLGNGATELLFFVARLFRGAQVTLALPVFSEFHRAFPDARMAPLAEPASWPRDGLVVMTRPANPTGWSLPLEELHDYLERSRATVLLDESFVEFSGLPSAASWLGEHPQLVVLRSLTKFYALPGLRIGALCGAAEAVAVWREQREPWQVNVLAEAAAMAALEDREHAAKSIEFVRSERAWLIDGLRMLPGVEPLASDANFILVRLGYAPDKLARHLLRRRILIRDCTGWPGIGGHAVRIAVRRRAENEQLLRAWGEFPCE